MLNTTNTHSEYVILIAFTLQQWLHERPSMLLYTYIACLVSNRFVSALLQQGEGVHPFTGSIVGTRGASAIFGEIQACDGDAVLL